MGRSGNTKPNPLQEHLPLVVAVKIVGHEEAAAQQIFAHDFGFLFGEAPFAHLHGVYPRPVERFVAVFHHHGLLDGPRLDARQAPHGLRKMTVGARIILGPERQALAEIAVEAARITVVRSGRKHQPREGPLARRLPIRRQLKVEIFDARKLAERLLERIERAEKNEAASQQTRCSSPDHRWHPSREYHSRGWRLLYCVRANSSSGAASDHRSALTAGFLGWTLDAFDFFLVTLCLTAIGKEFHQSDPAIAFSITLTLAFRPVISRKS